MTVTPRNVVARHDNWDSIGGNVDVHVCRCALSGENH